MRRGLVCVVVALLAFAGAVAAVGPSAGASSRSLSAFRRLGAWVDVFDYAPRLQRPGQQPKIRPDSISDMAALGVKTLYLQVANPDDAPANRLTDRAQLRALLERAHERGMAVVPWFLPRFLSPTNDLATVKQILKLRVGGVGFDGIGLDLESNELADIPLRNRRAAAFARKVRALVGDSTPIGAIVYPAVQLEVLNTALWPDFPYKAVNPSVDLWMPMSYYTYRSSESGLRNAFRYTVDSVERLRRRVGADVPVHLIGGLAEDSTPEDYLDMTRAATATSALGWSVYDYATTGSWAWPYLRGSVPVPTTSVPPTTAGPTTTTTTTTTMPPTTTTTVPSSTTTTTTAAPAPST
jgi:hypothetical protein